LTSKRAGAVCLAVTATTLLVSLGLGTLADGEPALAGVASVLGFLSCPLFLVGVLLVLMDKITSRSRTK
jgi:hypothetical protein